MEARVNENLEDSLTIQLENTERYTNALVEIAVLRFAAPRTIRII